MCFAVKHSLVVLEMLSMQNIYRKSGSGGVPILYLYGSEGDGAHNAIDTMTLHFYPIADF